MTHRHILARVLASPEEWTTIFLSQRQGIVLPVWPTHAHAAIFNAVGPSWLDYKNFILDTCVALNDVWKIPPARMPRHALMAAKPNFESSLVQCTHAVEGCIYPHALLNIIKICH